MTNQSSIKYISSLLDNPGTLSEGDQSSIALFRQTFPYFVPIRYLSALESHKKSAYSANMMSQILPYLGNWILFCEFLKEGTKENAQATEGVAREGMAIKESITHQSTEIKETKITQKEQPIPAKEPMPDPIENVQAVLHLQTEPAMPGPEKTPEPVSVTPLPTREEPKAEPLLVPEAVPIDEVFANYVPSVEPVAMPAEARQSIVDEEKQAIEPIKEVVTSMPDAKNEPEPVSETPVAEALEEKMPQVEKGNLFKITPSKVVIRKEEDAPAVEDIPRFSIVPGKVVIEEDPETGDPENIEEQAMEEISAWHAVDVAAPAPVDLPAQPDLSQAEIPEPTEVILVETTDVIPDLPPAREAPMEETVVISGPQEEELLIFPVYTEDYFLHEGVKVSGEIPEEIKEVASRDQKPWDKSLMVMMSFTEWLLHFKNTSQKQKEEKKDQKSLKTMWQKEKLAAAMEEENEEIPENVFEMAVNSIAKEDGLASESLADIYIKQGKYDKAIEMFRKLSLRNPKKNTYFARRIEEVLKEKQT